RLAGHRRRGRSDGAVRGNTENERDEFLAEQRSRERLRDVVQSALADGPVEVYACWAGDEDAAPVGEETIGPNWITDLTEPFEERVRYRLVAAPTPDRPG